MPGRLRARFSRSDVLTERPDFALVGILRVPQLHGSPGRAITRRIGYALAALAVHRAARVLDAALEPVDAGVQLVDAGAEAVLDLVDAGTQAVLELVDAGLDLDDARREPVLEARHAALQVGDDAQGRGEERHEGDEQLGIHGQHPFSVRSSWPDPRTDLGPDPATGGRARTAIASN